MQKVEKKATLGPVAGPLIVKSTAPNANLAEFIGESAAILREELLESGALLFRGFGLRTAEDFGSVVRAFTNSRLEYTYRSTPRTAVSADVFTATEFPRSLEIPLHSENAYQRDWPMLVAFACLQPALAGGATPISSIRRAQKHMGSTLLDTFEERKVKYVRHYRPYVDLPWQTVFQTDRKEGVAAFCSAHDIDHSWIDEDTLRTEQVCQGAARHPVIGERVFFNQAHLFHISALGKAAAQSLVDMFGEKAVPRNAFYGDGSELDLRALELVRNSLNREIHDVCWELGDVLLLDNMQFTHGRRTFTGERRIVVSLGDSYSSTDFTKSRDVSLGSPIVDSQ